MRTTVPTVRLTKNERVVIVNTGDAQSWIDDGYELVPEVPAPAPEPAPAEPKRRRRPPAEPAKATAPSEGAPVADDEVALLGSSTQPSVIEVDGAELALGDVVGEAFAKSGLSKAEWNALPDDHREQLIAAAIADLAGEDDEPAADGANDAATSGKATRGAKGRKAK